MTAPKKLAVAITTKNNLRTIRECLESVKDVADKIFVVDSGSTDGTVEICREMGAEVDYREWPGPVAQKQYAMDRCADHDWVLNLDSDEMLDAELAASIRNAVLTAGPEIAGFSFNRKVWFRGQWLDHVFQPEPRLRLVRPRKAAVHGIGPQGKGGHDYVKVEGEIAHLPGTCKHDSWADAAEMMRRYVELGARAAQYDPRRSNVVRVLFSPLGAFVKQYFLKQGFRDGRVGLLMCLGLAYGNAIKQMLKMAWDMEQRNDQS
ncbi:MAG: glycosyltransferase family 2 protein [Betaproteobacteria bacterium]|nr:MAG: glycosyltransferase family 2 protein [Betaproteobacteria bacterium]